MSSDIASLPDDPAALKAHIAQLTAGYESTIASQQSTINSLYERLKSLLSDRFGPSSEQLQDESGQQALFDESEALDEQGDDIEGNDDDTTSVQSHTRRRGKRIALPDALPRRVVEHDLADAEKVCPHDGSVLTRIGNETSERLHIIPATVEVEQHICHTYSCPTCHEHVVTAKKPPTLLPKRQATEGTLAFIADQKYALGMPLYRLEKALLHLGIHIPRQTQASWMIGCGQAVTPLIEALVKTLLAGDYVQMDETTVQVLNEPGKAAQSTSYMWVATGGDERGFPVRLFNYAPGRGSTYPKTLLSGYTGKYLQVDGYEGYNAVARENQLTLVYCFAHARRYFTKGLKVMGINLKQIPEKPPPKAKRLLTGLRYIQKLFLIERRIADKSPEERYTVRQKEAVPVLEELKDWALRMQPKVLPSSPTGKAIGYLLKHWDGLETYVDDGRLEISTNRTENAIRPFVVGRKAWMFSSTTRGADASANLYSLIETAKANGHSPYHYLMHVFGHLPQAKDEAAITALLPWNVEPETLKA